MITITLINNRKIDIKWDFRFLFLMKSQNQIPMKCSAKFNCEIKCPQNLIHLGWTKISECWLSHSIIRQFNEKFNGNTKVDYTIPPDFFDFPKPLVLAEIPYCPRNEMLSKCFIKKLYKLTNKSKEIKMKRITKKVEQLFLTKK